MRSKILPFSSAKVNCSDSSLRTADLSPARSASPSVFCAALTSASSPDAGCARDCGENGDQEAPAMAPSQIHCRASRIARCAAAGILTPAPKSYAPQSKPRAASRVAFQAMPSCRHIAQAQASRRRAAGRSVMPGCSRSAMPAMPPAMRPPPAHHGAARWAQLRIFRLHAGRDLGHVRDGVAAQAHRIGRAGLTLGVGALGGCAIDAINKYAGEHCQQADKTNNPHNHYPCPQRTLNSERFAQLDAPAT